ncbi:MAG: pseudouridine synthase [Desulfosalsimonadaceae bacterium]
MDKLLKIIYRDEYFIAVDKPPGLLVHRSPIDRKEKRFALQMVRNLVNRHVYPVHRLDRPTSGVLLFALSPEMLKQTAALFQAGLAAKKYLAVVRGYIPEKGTIDHPVKEIRDRFLCRQNNKPMEPSEKKPDAVTGYLRLAMVELPVSVDKYPATRYSLAALYPETGRRHQLRQHMKHVSHPIIGDTKYGKDVHNKFFAREFNCHGLLLSAVELNFTHPVTGKTVTIQVPPHPDFALILNRFNWNIL